MNFKSVFNREIWNWFPTLLLILFSLVLFPIFATFSTSNVNKISDLFNDLLFDKGKNLIWIYQYLVDKTDGKSLAPKSSQMIIEEMAQNTDVSYILIMDSNGRILAHNHFAEIGGSHSKIDEIDRNSIRYIQNRRRKGADNKSFFEVYRQIPPEKIETSLLQREKEKGGFNNKNYLVIGTDITHLIIFRTHVDKRMFWMALISAMLGLGGIFSLLNQRKYTKIKISLDEMTAFSNTVVENIPVGLLALDNERKIVKINKAAETLLKQDELDLVGHQANDMLPKPFLNLLDELGPSGTIIGNETECKIDSTTSIPLDISVAVLPGIKDQTIGYLFLFKNLSEVYALRQENSRNQRLISIGKLAAGVAHEVRNPLSSIKGFAVYFKEQYPENSQDQEIADIMIDEVERMDRVIGQLLEFAKPLKLMLTDVSLEEMINYSLRLTENQLIEKSITVEKNISSDVKPIKIDADRINQVLLNLYLNAIEAMESGGVLTVALENDDSKNFVNITIVDTGEGIPEDAQPLIFDPYFTTKQSGSGIGLANVYHIIEAHNGNIEVESTVGVGSRFMIQLPIIQ